jgi:hypothetical protein
VSNEKNGGTRIDIDFFWPCLVLWVLLTLGDPDLLDALIHYFMRAAQ